MTDDEFVEDCLIVARTHAALFRRWSLLDIAAEVWRIAVETGRPPHAVWRRAIDAYERETSWIPRSFRRSREKRGREVPAVEFTPYDADLDRPGPEADDPSRIDPAEDVREFIDGLRLRPREREILGLRARGLDYQQIGLATGTTDRAVATCLSTMRKRIGAAA